MGVAQAVLAARKEIPNIVTDETATISGAKGSFKFKYATLAGILETIVPILAKHDVLLIQKVSGDSRVLEIETVLIGSDDTHITSGKIRVDYDGTTRDLAGKSTSVKRVQLVALLGLTVVDDDNEQTATTAPPPRTQPAPPLPSTRAVLSNVPENMLRAAQAGKNPQNNSASPALRTLMSRIQLAEENDRSRTPMPTVPAEGKSMSMYHYLVDQVSQQTLCYLYGRVIDVSSPPLLATKFLLDEVMAGKHVDELAEAYVKAR